MPNILSIEKKKFVHPWEVLVSSNYMQDFKFLYTTRLIEMDKRKIIEELMEDNYIDGNSPNSDDPEFHSSYLISEK